MGAGPGGQVITSWLFDFYLCCISFEQTFYCVSLNKSIRLASPTIRIDFDEFSTVFNKFLQQINHVFLAFQFTSLWNSEGFNHDDIIPGISKVVKTTILGHSTKSVKTSLDWQVCFGEHRNSLDTWIIGLLGGGGVPRGGGSLIFPNVP